MITKNYKFGQLAETRLYESPLLARLRLAKQSCNHYPMDDMDFIMMDIERPEAFHRHADFCTGDLTGRYLEFLAVSMPHDKSDENRMHELFWRLLKCQSPSGPIGRVFVQDLCTKDTLYNSSDGVTNKLFMGLLQYYLYTGNGKALDAAGKTAEYIFNFTNPCNHYGCNTGWLTDPMALFYAITNDLRALDYCHKVKDDLKKLPLEKTHSHGLMTTLRGLQMAAMYTGDLSFNEQPERFRKLIAEQAVWVDGNIPELFPSSRRNEGCSIADWVMLNLNAGFLTGADEAYEKAELAMYNALGLSQLSNGRFSLRAISQDKRCYLRQVEEAWFCCVHNGGLALVKYADHVVSLQNNIIKINFLVPGHYELVNNGQTISIDITTGYPETYHAIILVKGAPNSMDVKIRQSSFVRNIKLDKQQLPGNRDRYILNGDMGYYLERVENGVILKYGPLVMAPLQYAPPQKDTDNPSGVEVEGIVPDFRADYPAIIPPEKKDDAGFLVFDNERNMGWICFEEGPRSRMTYGCLSVNVPLRFPEGTTKVMRFYPELSKTTIMKEAYFPIVFECNN
ncbi:MAG: beta-L-arabinofuranosidase domain-containing protein [Victivallaceae bacterium]